jgi:DNA-binding transcriptional ArsR family regulator
MEKIIEPSQGRAEAPARSPGSQRSGPARHGITRDREYFQPIAFLVRSLSDENRLRILRCISGGKRSVTSIVEELNLSQPLVSHHLRELKRSLLVKIERNGPFNYYELSDARILDIIQCLNTLANDLLSAENSS